MEEKYKKAMVSNAQLDNEKTNFLYQVDTLKDMLLELEEQLAESRRQYDEKNKVSVSMREDSGVYMCVWGGIQCVCCVCVCVVYGASGEYGCVYVVYSASDVCVCGVYGMSRGVCMCMYMYGIQSV